MSTTLEYCREVSAQLDKLGHHTVDGGMDCLAYSVDETAAMHFVAQNAYDLGARVFQDQAGNITAVMEGSNPGAKAILGGSHLDAVPQGGQYDGRAGVLIQLAVLKELKDNCEDLEQDVVLQISRAEESPRFGKALLGSLYATGLGKVEDFNRQAQKGDSETLKEAIKKQGLPVDELLMKVQNGDALLLLDHFGMAIEMHIEQADVIRRSNADLGIVTGIRGNVRADIRFKGEAGHTGGAAQFEKDQEGNVRLNEHDDPIDVRQEASGGIVDLGYLFRKKCQEIAKGGRDIVFSIPQLDTPDSSATKLCDNAYARLEVRSTDQSVLDEMANFIDETSAMVAQDNDLYFADEDKLIVTSAPVPELSNEVATALEDAAKNEGLKTIRMVSGAGHDMMNFALAGIPTAGVFVPHNGLSHRPDEDMVLNKGDDPYAINSPFANALRTIFRCTKDSPVVMKEDSGKKVTLSQAMLNNGATELKF